MDDAIGTISRLLSDVILPGLQVVHASQTQQIEANHRLEAAIQQLREQLQSQFAEMSTQLMAYRAELAATQAMLQAIRSGNSTDPDSSVIVH